jgi:hypothetical protein
MRWLLGQWLQIRGNFKFWVLCGIGSLLVTAAIAITHDLLLWQRIVLSLLFLVLFAWAVIATYVATRAKAAPLGEALQSDVSVTTTGNIQTKVREWIDAFNYDHAVSPWESWHFGYRVNLPSGPLVYIARPKARDGEYLLLSGRITAVGWEDQAAFDALTPEERRKLFHQVRLETARAKFFFYSDANLQQISFDNWVPITPKLTAATFIENINKMYFSAQILWSTMSLQLGSTPTATLPAPIPDTEGPPPAQETN